MNTCPNCSREYSTPPRKGQCRRCNDYKIRTGKTRPASPSKIRGENSGKKAEQTFELCKTCNQDIIFSLGECQPCWAYRRYRGGKARPPEIYNRSPVLCDPPNCDKTVVTSRRITIGWPITKSIPIPLCASCAAEFDRVDNESL